MNKTDEQIVLLIARLARADTTPKILGSLKEPMPVHAVLEALSANATAQLAAAVFSSAKDSVAREVLLAAARVILMKTFDAMAVSSLLAGDKVDDPELGKKAHDSITNIIEKGSN